MAKERLYTSRLRKIQRRKLAKVKKTCKTEQKEAALAKAFPALKVQLDKSQSNPMASLSTLKAWFEAGSPRYI